MVIITVNRQETGENQTPPNSGPVCAQICLIVAKAGLVSVYQLHLDCVKALIVTSLIETDYKGSSSLNVCF